MGIKSTIPIGVSEEAIFDFLGDQDLDVKESVEKLISEVDKETEVARRIDIIRQSYNKFKNK